MLLLGSAETNGSQNDLFNTIESKSRIYQRSGMPKTEELFDFPGSFSHQRQEFGDKQIIEKVSDNIQALTDQILLQQFSPASVLVNDKGDILYITGSTGKYLAPAAGKASMNLFSMAREGLRGELPVAFRKAMQTTEKILIRNVRVGSNGGSLYVDVKPYNRLPCPMPLKESLL